jgi:hypothetical protein
MSINSWLNGTLMKNFNCVTFGKFTMKLTKTMHQQKQSNNTNKTSLLDYLDSIYNHVQHADRVYCRVNENLKQSLNQYHSLVAADKEPKPSTPQENVISHTTTTKVNTHKKPIQPKKQSGTVAQSSAKQTTPATSKLEKILNQAKAIRMKEAEMNNQQHVSLPDISEKQSMENQIPKQQIPEEKVITTEQEAKKKMDHLLSLKKKKQKSQKNCQDKFSHLVTLLSRNISSNTKKDTELTLQMIYKYQTLLAVSEYIDVMNHYLNEIIDFSDMKWNSDTNSPTVLQELLFTEIYSQFDKTVSQTLVYLDSDQTLKQYEAHCLSVMDNNISDYSTNQEENYINSHLSTWIQSRKGIQSIVHPLQLNYTDDQNIIQPAITVKDESESVRLSNLRQQIQQLQLQELVEDLLSQYLLPQLDKIEGKDRKKLYRLLESCLLNMGKI